MTKGKDLTAPTSPTPQTIDRAAIQKQNQEIARNLWQGKLSKAEQQAMNNLANLYGLDPLQKQLLCLGGNFYVTVGGLKVIAERSDTPPQAIQLEAATMEERNLAGITENDPTKPTFVHYWKALLFKPDSQTPYIEYGEASASDIGIRGQGGGSAKPKDVRAVARTRATGRVLRNAYSIGLPLAEDAPTDIVSIEAEIIHEAQPDIKPEEKPAKASDKINKTRIARLHVLKKKALDIGAITEESYYNVLDKQFGVAHSNELTAEKGEKFIQKLEDAILKAEPPDEPAEEETPKETPMEESPDEFFNQA